MRRCSEGLTVCSGVAWVDAKLNGLLSGSLEDSVLKAVLAVEAGIESCMSSERPSETAYLIFVLRICAFWSAEAEESTVTKKTPAALRENLLGSVSSGSVHRALGQSGPRLHLKLAA